MKKVIFINSKKYKNFKNINIQSFNDNEYYIKNNKKYYIKNSFYIHLINNNINISIIKFLLSIDFLKRKFDKLILFIPYLWYSRQDKIKDKSCVFSKIIAKIIIALKINNIFTFEIHSKHILNMYKGLLINISVFHFFFKYIKSLFPINKTLIIFPDKGGINRFKNNSLNKYKINYIYLNKKRIKNSIYYKNKNIKNKKYKYGIIFDDIIDTGITLFKSTNIIFNNGIKNIYVFAVHPVFSSNIFKKINNSKIKKMYIFNTIKPNQYNKKIKFINLLKIYKNLFNEYI
ncbi:ribose-phosphate diphosphokinase [Candidatus Vidania fulgoroideorum]